jgi:hypothetical protein
LIRSARIVAAAVVTLAVLDGDARGDERSDEKSMCSAKYQSAQRQRAAGKLTLARTDLLQCAEPACPPFVSNDCKTWLAEVDRDLPTLVFAVLDSNGGDVPSAVVRVDGVDVANATDGLGHAVDPGGHVFEASAGGQTLRQQLVVRVAEKSRRVELRLPIASAQLAEGSASSPRVHIGVYVLGSVGVAGLAVGTALWIAGSHAAKTYNADCITTGCTESQRTRVARELVAGDLAWGLGLAAGIGAVAVVLGHHDAAATVSFGPSGVSVAGVF